MKQTYLKRLGSRSLKLPAKFCRHASGGVADPMDASNCFPVLVKSMMLALIGLENLNLLGPVYSRSPAVQGVVIAMDDVGGNSVARQLCKPVAESKLSSPTAVGTVIDIAGHEQKVDFVLESSLNEIVKSFKGSVSQALSNLFIDLMKAYEGTVKMKVRCMDESKV